MGNDIVLLGLPEKKVEKIIKYVIKQAKNGKISQERINTSVEKILSMKEKYNVSNELVNGANIEEINNRIKNIKDKVVI